MIRRRVKKQAGRRLTAVILSLLMLLQSASAFADSIDAPETSPEAITEAAEQIVEPTEEVIAETTEETAEEATEKITAAPEETTDTAETTQDPGTIPVIDTSESVTMFMPGFMLKPAYFEGTLIHNGPDYTVTAVIGKDAMLPADVSMRVAEVLPGTELYEFYREMMAETLEEDEEMGEFARLFDIAFIAVIDGEETEFEPAADIDVQITFLEAIAVTEEIDVQAVHFEENTPEVMDVSTDSLAAAADDDEAIDTLSFTSDSFSIYGFFQKVKKVIKVITASGETFAIDVSFTSDSGIPDDAELTATEITPDDPEYEAYRAQALTALDAGDAGNAFFFDIRISKDGEKIEPEGPVTVAIAMDEMPEETAEVAVVHFGEEKTEIIEEVDISGTDVQFQAESFSVYGVITDPVAESDPLNGFTAMIFRRKTDGTEYYFTSEQTGYGYGDTLRIEQKTEGDNREAATWFFEATGTPNVYYIYTLVNDTRKYISIREQNENSNNNSRSVYLSDQPTSESALTMEKQRDGTYKIGRSIGGRMYRLNHWGDGTPGGFAAYYSPNDNPGEHMILSFSSTETTDNSSKYVVVVELDGEYYTVQSDGSLIPCVYHPETNLIEMEAPLLWSYISVPDSSTNVLRIPEQALEFDGNQLPTRFSYRYINPNHDTGIVWEKDIYTDSDGKQQVTSLMNECQLKYENHTIHGVMDNGSDNGNYIGVTEDLGKLKLSGNQDSSNAAIIHMAVPTLPTSAFGTSNAVNHIDVSVSGTANLDLAFAYGTYYDRDGNEIIVDKGHPYTYSVSNQSIAIKQEDMVRSEISAYKVNSDGSQTPLDDMFYVTGYSNNGSNQGADQVRIEGFFKVSYTDVPGKNGDATSRQARLDTPVYYTVTVPKPVTVSLLYNGEEVFTENPVENPSAEPLEVTTTVMLSASFTYWDINNQCPACRNNLGGTWHEYHWWNGEDVLIGDIPDGVESDKYHSGSGMDFTLNYTGSQGTIAAEIIKYVVDEHGSQIQVASEPKYSFDIYYNKDKNPNYVQDFYGVQEADLLNELDLESYTKLHTKNTMVGSNGSGILYDYDVANLVSGNTYALIYIREDPDSIDQTIVDLDGRKWDYTGETRIITEYVTRTEEHPDHELEGYTGIPEVIGHFKYKDNPGHGNGLYKDSQFLEFHVYNVYTQKTEINVDKIWLDGDGNPTDPPNEDVTVKLIRYKDGSEGPTPPTPTVQVPVSSYHIQNHSNPYNRLNDFSGSFPLGSTITISYNSNQLTTEVFINGTLRQSFSDAGMHSLTYTISSEDPVEIEVTDSWYPNGINGEINVYLASGKSMIRKETEAYKTARRISWFDPAKLIAANGVAVTGSNTGMPGTYGIDKEFDEPTLVLNNANSWKDKFTDLDVCDQNGRLYYYSIEEIEVPGYETTYSQNVPIAATEEDIHITVYNEKIPPKLGDISLKKTVAGEGCDPDKEFVFTINIVDENGDAVTSFAGEHGDVTFAGGTATVTLKASDAELKWIRNLPDGTRYTIQETPVEGYQQGEVTVVPEGGASVDDDGVITGTVTGGEPGGQNSAAAIQVQNIHVPTVDISATKNWAEGTTDYQKAKAIRFELYRKAGEAEGETGEPEGETTGEEAEEPEKVTEVPPAILVGNDDWTNSCTWEKLPRYVDSTADPLVEYIYSVKETGVYYGELVEGQVPDGAEWSSAAPDDIYTIEYSDITAGVITVTNTPKTINIPVEKKWTGIEADTLDWTITVKLQSDHEVTVDPDTMIISKATAESERTFRNLPKYYNGQEIVYTVEETGYLVKRGDEVLYSKDGTTTIGEKEVTTYYSYLMDESRENQKALITNSIATATFTVYKEWKDIVNKNDMPAVHFTLYCYRTSEGRNSASVYVDENNIRCENLELSPGTQWKWEKELPDYYPGDDQNPGNKLCYYIVETKDANGKVEFDKSTIPTELQNSRFIEEESYVSSQGRHTDPNSEQVQDPYNAYVEGGTGSITVTNRAPGGYMQMDIKKKFLMHQDGSLYTVTGFDVLKQNRVIEVQIYRRAVEDIAITIQQFHPNVPIVQKDGWRPYGDRIRVGYDSAGNPVKDPGNNTFTVDYGGDWHWTINQGNHKGGLPKYGFVYNSEEGQYESVRYQYVLVETGMYKDLSGTPLDDGFDWYAILPAVWEANGQIIMFDQEIAQDQDRMMNAQGTDLTVTKNWKGKPQPGTKVYIKVFRLADMNYNPGSAEDYTAKINKPIANWSGGDGLPIPNDGIMDARYLDTTTAGGPYIVLSEENNWTVTINRTLAAGKNGAYRYWIQEVGYSYQNGDFVQNVSQFNPEYSVISGWSEGVFNNNPTGIKAIVLERKGQNNLGVTNTVTETTEDFSKTWQNHLGEAVDWPTGKSLTVVLSRYSGEGDARQKDTSFEYTITVTPDGENFSCSVTPQTDAIRVEKVSMTEGKKYTFRISGLPARNGDAEWDYVVEETQEPDGYTFMAGEGENEFINKAESTERYATKAWNDEENAFDTRPESITFKLIAKVNNTALNDAEMASEGITTDEQPAEQTLTRPEDETADWGTADWTNLPKITKAGLAIEYSIEELTVPGYTSEAAAWNEDKLTWTVTNTLNQTDIRIIKRKHKEEDDESPDELLTGAEFRLDRKNGGSAFVPVGDAAAVNNVGELSFTGLPDGEYRIVETKSPAGYMPLASPITFTIANGKVNEESIVASSLVTYTAATESLPATFTVDNRPGVALPSTGGEGTAPYILTGIALMAFAGILLLDRKRKAHK